MDNNEFQTLDHQLLDDATQLERVEFYKKTYSHVAGGFLVFILLEFLFLNTPAIVEFSLSLTQGFTWLIVLGLFMLATTQAEKMVGRATNVKQQYLGYFIYILAEAFIFVPLLYIAMYATGGSNILLQAFALTLALFAGLSAMVFITKKDFSFLHGALTIGGFIALGLIVAGMIFGFDLGLWFSVAMVALAAGSILYQTSNLRYRYDKSQHVLAALGLFASFMLLLWYIIRILMSRD